MAAQNMYNNCEVNICSLIYLLDIKQTEYFVFFLQGLICSRSKVLDLDFAM